MLCFYDRFPFHVYNVIIIEVYFCRMFQKLIYFYILIYLNQLRLFKCLIIMAVNPSLISTINVAVEIRKEALNFQIMRHNVMRNPVLEARLMIINLHKVHQPFDCSFYHNIFCFNTLAYPLSLYISNIRLMDRYVTNVCVCL